MASTTTTTTKLIATILVLALALTPVCNACCKCTKSPPPKAPAAPPPKAPAAPPKAPAAPPPKTPAAPPKAPAAPPPKAPAAPPKTPAAPPPKAHCPIDTLKLGACADVLGLVHAVIGTPPSGTPCCALLKGLADLEAALCLCTAIKANVLGIHLDVPITLSVILSACEKDVPDGFKCP